MHDMNSSDNCNITHNTDDLLFHRYHALIHINYTIITIVNKIYLAELLQNIGVSLSHCGAILGKMDKAVTALNPLQKNTRISKAFR